MSDKGRVRVFMRAVTGLAAAFGLLSAIAVVGSNLFEPGYHETHHDALWLVVAYAAVQAVTVHAFARDTWLVPWLAVARASAGLLLASCAAGGLVFLVPAFAAAGALWMALTPSRYVYQLFDWGYGLPLPLAALIFLGRGVWNVLAAFFFTQPWWTSLRRRRPLLGRFVTAVPIAAVTFCLWAFLQTVRMGAQAFSVEAHEVAEMVVAGLDCDAIRAHEGQTTTDLRQRGERRYTVTITYRCADTRVLVNDPDGKVGAAGGPRRECCAPAG